MSPIFFDFVRSVISRVKCLPGKNYIQNLRTNFLEIFGKLTRPFFHHFALQLTPAFLVLILGPISTQYIHAQGNSENYYLVSQSVKTNVDIAFPLWMNTGSNHPLSSVSIPLEILPWELAPMLLFDFGFSTKEQTTLASLHDSFSVTLSDSKQTNIAMLLSTDIYGVNWITNTPGGLTLASDSIVYREIPFTGNYSNSQLSVAYSVAVILPREFAGLDATLYLDLFDNQDGLDSAAYCDRVRIESGLPPIYLQSSTKSGGPYADESITMLDRRMRNITVPKYGRARFYRAKGNVPVKIKMMRPLADRVVFSYDFSTNSTNVSTPQVFGLESSAQSNGPYSDETGVTIQPSEKTITLWRGAEKRFYRIRADMLRRIVQYRIQGENLILSYE